MRLEELQVYNLAMDIGERVWVIVEKWNYFQKDTVGKQWVRAADSMAANLSEGFGRFHYKENRQFCYYSRGSLFETKTWLTKAHKRRIVGEDEYHSLVKDLNVIGIKLNNYIKSIGTQGTTDRVKESPATYLENWDDNDSCEAAQ
ncbi:MAG: four helix bundle protein [Verrucomicrobia bacterium]|jgi:four helix bundle protein|nr:four helix bundle protein [Verrucomicrobiota bacterium]